MTDSPILVWGDSETGSTVDLKSCGAYRYAEDPSTFVQLFSYAVGDGEVKLWDAYSGEPMPDDLREYLINPRYIWRFHNVQFDRLIIRHCLKIEIPIRRFRCSMAQAFSHALPGSLEKCGEVLGIKEEYQKIKDGKRLVQLFCKPRKQKDGTLKWATPETHPEEWKRYKEYCIRDTEAMREITKKMPKWNYPRGTELELWFLDQEINDRGIYIDLEMANRAVETINEEKKILNARTKSLTGGEVEAASQRDALLKHMIESYDIEIPDMRKATLEKLLTLDDLPTTLRELIEVRLSTSTSSTAKYSRIIKATCSDNRVHGTIQYAGAGRTSRDSGRLIQVQNFPRPTMKEYEIFPGIDALKNGTLDIFDYDVMQFCSSALRYAITAPPGHRLFVSDLANIEGRVLAWLAGEEWKLQAFRDYDAGIGPDMYIAAFAEAFGMKASEISKDSLERQIGKVMELAFGYKGRVGAFLAFAGKIDLNTLVDTVLPTIGETMLKKSDSFYEWMNGMDIEEADAKIKKHFEETQEILFLEDVFVPEKTFGLSKEVFMAVDCLARKWRDKHSKIVQFWSDSESAMRNAVEVEGVQFHFGKCYAIREKNWIRIVLPNGRSIPYPGMKIGKDGILTFKGQDQFTKKWKSIKTAGGKITENATQALARDIFKFGELEAAKQDYKIVFKVHDELVVEEPEGSGRTVKDLEAVMSIVPPWAKGLPLAAEGKESYRYHK